MDPFLKERLFGLTGPEGNHGEDVKECWWYLDSTPTHSWMRWRYMYPQAEFPYQRLRAENRARDPPAAGVRACSTPGIFDAGRYWEVTADYAKAAPEDMLVRITARNAGPDAATLHLLPDAVVSQHVVVGTPPPHGPTPVDRLRGGALVAEHPELGRRTLTGSGGPAALFCENETNAAPCSARHRGRAGRISKDGIGDHVVGGADTVNPEQRGTKAAFHYRLTVDAGASRRFSCDCAIAAPASASTSRGDGRA